MNDSYAYHIGNKHLNKSRSCNLYQKKYYLFAQYYTLLKNILELPLYKRRLYINTTFLMNDIFTITLFATARSNSPHDKSCYKLAIHIN